MNARVSAGLPIASIVLATVALGLASFSVVHHTSVGVTSTTAITARASLLSTIEKNGTIRAGYGVFPPYTQEDPRTGKVSGVSVDIVEEIARQIGAKVEWHRMNWNTMGADLERGQFDVVADPIFQTPQRGREFTFSEPYSYFAIGIAVVRKGESRFRKFDDINDPNVTVAVGQGTGEEAFVRARAPRARLDSIPVAQDSATPINSVLTGRADIAISNIDDARRFVAAHSSNLQMLWADSPPAYIPAGFALRMGDTQGAEFLNVSLRNLKATGVLSTIAARNGTIITVSDPITGR
jgi:ABC-type amino acid transport substrate-binding protein